MKYYDIKNSPINSWGDDGLFYLNTKQSMKLWGIYKVSESCMLGLAQAKNNFGRGFLL